MDTSAIRRARDVLGGTTRLSAASGVSAPTASEWISGKRRIPIARCLVIERATAGAVTVEELRPDVDWAVIRGKPAVPGRDAA